MGHCPLLPQQHPNTRKNIEEGGRLTSKVAMARTQLATPVAKGGPKVFRTLKPKEVEGFGRKERDL